ncbi:cupin domain-containing protein [Cytophagaceae bacterium DM2B3-1]|uniref:Cupin domain-containing protein n=1 Tax=Xanthocytophaga flava TaxID=3048013 RepID=A0ABT7CR03_9BACT|nr:cupin domain-containing protein [Xanthocytophaga flavus]MDJ1496163.1 cupin domain-containing protein [Xanthocytophaga flavus]
MKRYTFLTVILSLIGYPLLALSKIKNSVDRINKGFKISAGEGRKYGHLTLKGVNQNVLDVKISGSDTNGDLAIFEQTSLSKGRGTPLHVHPSQDEIFYVIEGSYLFKVGEDKYHLTAGDSIFLPRQVPHAWTQAADKGKMLVILQPAGKLENFFVNVAGLDHEPSAAEVASEFSKNEMQVVGPPLKLE